MAYRCSFVLLLVCASHVCAMHACVAQTQPSLVVPFTVRTDAGDTMTVHAGIDPGASPGLDAAMGETEIPPPPPDGAFDVRFVDPDTLRNALGEGSWLDIRCGDPHATATQEHILLCRPGAAAHAVVTWDLPPGVAAFMAFGDASPPRRFMATGGGAAALEGARPTVAIHITVHYNVRVLSIRALLEGAYDGRAGRMRTSLLDLGVLRAHFPARPLPASVVDSIGIELRDPVANAGAAQPIMLPAWLLADGTVCPFTPPFDSPLLIPDPVRRGVYPVIHHRNHVSAACAQMIPAGVTAAECDMTSGTDMYLDGNAANLAPGVWGLIVGDVNGDGRPGTWDRAMVRAAIGILRTYEACDVDMNGGVGATDLALVRRSIGAPMKEP